MNVRRSRDSVPTSQQLVSASKEQSEEQASTYRCGLNERLGIFTCAKYLFLLQLAFVNSAFIDLIASSESGNSSSEEGSECLQMQHAIAQSLKEEK